MMRRTKGFTLIELLVVIAIIGLLVSILVPSIAQAQRLAKRVACAANLNGIGKAIMLYRGANDEAFPFIRNIAGMDYDASMTGTADTCGGLGGETALNINENLCLLVAANMAPWKMFRCTAQSGQILKRDNDDKKYGWVYDDVVYLDYAYHIGYRSTVDVDGNPAALNDNLEQAVAILGDQPEDAFETGLDGATVNHGDDGINLLFAGLNVQWHPKDSLGGYGDDCVFTSTGDNGNSPGDNHDTVLVKPVAGSDPVDDP